MVSYRRLTLSFVLVVLFIRVFANILLYYDIIRTEKGGNSEVRNKKIDQGDDFNLPLIVIGGMPRSGTTLMRTMLESHPDIRCGPETHVIPELMFIREEWIRNADELVKLKNAGVYPEALDIAMKKFILEIIKHHAPPATYYCNKDPLVLTQIGYFRKLFPNSKFILMIRDGRACAHSIVSRQVPITRLNITSYRAVLRFWNGIIKKMYSQCLNITEKVCLPVHYEQLVLQPVNNTKRIFKFLDIPWRREVLHHDQYVNATKLSSVEFSTDQVQRPLYLDALTSWFGHIPPDVEKDMEMIAPMLSVLGYDPNNPTPAYGKPDDFVLGKLKL